MEVVMPPYPFPGWWSFGNNSMQMPRIVPTIAAARWLKAH
jgi:hypothetical protein